MPDEVFADEQIRRVQEELRKRHLFYANPNGEKGPALSIAVRRYQQKKGFPATGVIDSVTLASLGLSSPSPAAANTPVAIGRRGQIHGANGESLPSHSALLGPSQRVSKFDPAFGDYDYLELALEDFQPPGSGPRQTSGLTSERIGESMTQPAWNTLALPPPAEGRVDLSVVENERQRQAALRPNRRSQRRSPSVKQREEKNPLVLTYRSVNRALRSLFGDAQTKKKRSASKRL